MTIGLAQMTMIFILQLLHQTYLCYLVKTGKLCWEQSLKSCGN